MSPRKVRVAGIGAGYFSQFHVAGWRAIEDVQVVGWCDTNRERAQAVAGALGVPAFDDADAMLAEARPDLADIVTPPATHLALVELAASHGVPVICQKALAPSYGEAEAIVRAAEKARVPLAVHENFRWQPWYREAKRLLDAGTIGTPHSIAFRLRPGDGQGPRAYLDRQPYFQRMPRFLVYETAIHWIDTFRFLMGDVRAVTARLRRVNPAIDGEDAGYLVFEFANGATGLFDGNRANDHVAANPRRTMGEMWLEGSAGVLRMDGDAHLWWKPHHGDEVEHVYARGDDAQFGGGCVEALQRHVVAHLLDGAPLENAGREYLANIGIQDACYRSHESGRRIEL